MASHVLVLMVRAICHSYRSKSIAPKPRPPDRSKLDPIARVIDRALENDNELSAAKLWQILVDLSGLSVSVSTIKKYRHRLGWMTCGPKLVQMVAQR